MFSFSACQSYLDLESRQRQLANDALAVARRDRIAAGPPGAVGMTDAFVSLIASAAGGSGPMISNVALPAPAHQQAAATFLLDARRGNTDRAHTFKLSAIGSLTTHVDAYSNGKLGSRSLENAVRLRSRTGPDAGQ